MIDVGLNRRIHPQIDLGRDAFAALPAFALIDCQHREDLCQGERAGAGKETVKVGPLALLPQLQQILVGFAPVGRRLDRT